MREIEIECRKVRYCEGGDGWGNRKVKGLANLQNIVLITSIYWNKS